MSVAVACGWTVLRCLVIALLSVPVSWGLQNWLRALSGWRRTVAWASLLLPFFTPDLFVGYAYSNFSLSLIRYPVWNEFLYGWLVLVKLVPMGTLALCIWPPGPVSAEALHCYRLALAERRAVDLVLHPARQGVSRASALRTLLRISRSAEAREPPTQGRWRPMSTVLDGMMRRWEQSVGMLIRGPARNLFPVAGIIFLLAFQEFEIASLMGTESWTVWLFDAQVGGLLLTDSLWFALLPVACEVVLLIPVLLLAIRSSNFTPAAKQLGRRPSRPTMLLLTAYLLVAMTLVCGIPLTVLGRGALDGLAALWANSSQLLDLVHEILRGLAWGLVSGIGAYGVGAWLLSSRIGSRGVAAVSLPGLFGSLILSLILLCVFQLPYLNALYDTPLPLATGLVLFLLPRALVLQLFLRIVQPRERLHLATLLANSPAAGQGHEIVWHLRFRGHFWSIVLLCYWGYLDLTLSSLLAPVGMTSAPVRLYNFMHYGRSTVLSAMTCVAIVVPLLLFVVLATARRRLLRVLVP